jgi:hypothetical protein
MFLKISSIDNTFQTVEIIKNFELYDPYLTKTENENELLFNWDDSSIEAVSYILEKNSVIIYEGENNSFQYPKMNVVGDEVFTLYTLLDGKKQKVGVVLLSPIVELFNNYGNIDFGSIGWSSGQSQVIQAKSIENNKLEFAQFQERKGYSINMTFSPLRSNIGSEIDISNLVIKKMTSSSQNGVEETQPFAFQNDTPTEIIAIVANDVYKNTILSVLPSDIELTIPANFILVSGGTELLMSIVTYSVVTIP